MLHPPTLCLAEGPCVTTQSQCPLLARLASPWTPSSERQDSECWSVLPSSPRAMHTESRTCPFHVTCRRGSGRFANEGTSELRTSHAVGQVQSRGDTRYYSYFSQTPAQPLEDSQTARGGLARHCPCRGLPSYSSRPAVCGAQGDPAPPPGSSDAKHQRAPPCWENCSPLHAETLTLLPRPQVELSPLTILPAPGQTNPWAQPHVISAPCPQHVTRGVAYSSQSESVC